MLVPTKGGEHGRYYVLPWSNGKKICQVVLECLPDVREKFMLADPRSGGKLAMGFFSVDANNGSRVYTIARKPVYGAGGVVVRHEDAEYRIVIGTWNGGPEALYRDGVGSGNVDTQDAEWREWLMMLYQDPTSSINQHPKMVAFTNPALFQAADEATHCVTQLQGNSSKYFAYRQMDTPFTVACSIFGTWLMRSYIDELSIRLAGGAQGGFRNRPANSIVFAACSRTFTTIRGHRIRRDNLVAGDQRGPRYWAIIRRHRDRYRTGTGNSLLTNSGLALEEDVHRAVLELNRDPYICIFGANNERTYFPLHPKFFKRLAYYDVSIVRPVHDPYAPDLNGPDG